MLRPPLVHLGWSMALKIRLVSVTIKYKLISCFNIYIILVLSGIIPN